jgi:PhzF family phenazine biosynthesis protein
MPTHGFAQVDVFTDIPLRGNPVAVVMDADDLSTAEMQAFCDWTNLSEATFLVPPSHPAADYAVRIFSPGRELPFAGHPTLGTCHAWLEAGGHPRAGDVIVQECGAGLVPIRRDSGALAFAAPERRRSGPLSPDLVDRLVAALGIDPCSVLDHQWCDNGPAWHAILLESADQVLAVRPKADLMAGLDVGIAGLHGPGGPADLEVRAFFTGNGGVLAEDPVTGSLNAALGQWLIPSGVLPSRYVARQGTALGRDGRVTVESEDGTTWVGGRTTTVLAGRAHIVSR